MDFTQNERINQITEKTLIIGIDIAKYKHVARAIDDRGRDLAKRLIFRNTRHGFTQLLDWANTLATEHEKTHVMIGVEPTGHYWLTLAYYLKELGIEVVVVNPMKVKKSKELDDDSPTKNDTKDAKVIAQVIRVGRYHKPTLPEGLYAELREGMKLHEMIQEDLASIKAQMHNVLDRYFPEFLTVFKDWTGKTALHLLEKGYFPGDIRNCSEEELLSEVKTATNRAVGRKRIIELKTAADSSVGITVGLRMGREEMRYLVNQYQNLKERLQAHEALLEELVQYVPGADIMKDIRGISPITVAAFFAEIGDLSNYRDPRQIIKLAGLNLRLNQSGLFKGQTTITKRGRRRLRTILYKAVVLLVIHNDGFKQLHHYYKTRLKNPLTGKQSFIALCRKLIKIFFVLGTRQCTFSEERMLSDIPQLQEAV